MKNEALQRAKGVRDFGPAEKIARDKIVGVLKGAFESFGYNPIETPVMERYELFASKYGIGQESDAMRETFKLRDQGLRDLVLRTEFTVPFARFVGMNPQLKMPFKRYQIGKVFRDGPIKLGRYREFYQCDVDVVGIANSKVDAEIMQLAIEAFTKLNLEVEVQINNRKVLNSILDFAGVDKDKQGSVIITIDKLEKIGADGVMEELTDKGIEQSQIKTILSTISIEGTNDEILVKLKEIIGESDGLDEVKVAIDNTVNKENLRFVPSLARGLAYYTGNVFEVYLKDTSQINSSICAGGRYDSMIGGFIGTEEIYPAVGISFGLETIFDAIRLSEKKEEVRRSVVDVYLAPLDEAYVKKCSEIAKQLRDAGFTTDMDYLGRKLKKNLEYANSYGVPWVIMLGETEVAENKIALKDMIKGDQEILTVDEAIKKIQQ